MWLYSGAYFDGSKNKSKAEYSVNLLVQFLCMKVLIGCLHDGVRL